jgi:hypothetical protein
MEARKTSLSKLKHGFVLGFIIAYFWNKTREKPAVPILPPGLKG